MKNILFLDLYSQKKMESFTILKTVALTNKDQLFIRAKQLAKMEREGERKIILNISNLK